MTISGSGGGSGNVGGPQQPTIEELNATAFVTVAKELLGIGDSLQRPISDVDREGFLKYRSPANRPNLANPLELLRLATSGALLSDEALLTAYDALFSKLPADVQEELTAQNQLPFAERDINFVVLDNVLTFTAQALVSLNNAAQPIDPASIEAGRAQMNLTLPLLMMASTVSQSEAILNLATNVVNGLGPNSPNFDTFLNFLNQANESLSSMKDAANAFVNAGQNDSSGLKPGLNELSNAIAAMATSFSGLQNLQDLQILSSVFDAMALTTAAMTLDPAAQPLLLSLSLASVGLSSDSSALSLTGSASKALSNAIAQGLLSSAVLRDTSLNAGANLLFPALVTTSLFSSMVMASLIFDNGIGPLPPSDAADNTNARLFTLDLVLSLAINSTLANTTFAAISQSIGDSPATQQIVAGTLTLAALFLMIMAVKETGKVDVNALLDSFTAPLIHELEKTSQLVNEEIHKRNISADIEKGLEKHHELAVNIQQAILALQNQNFDELIAVFTKALEGVGISAEDLQKDLKGVQEFAKLISTTFNQGMEEQTNNITGISQAA